MDRRVAVLLVVAFVAIGCILRGAGLGGYTLTHWDEGAIWQGARWFATLGAEGHYSPTTSPPLVPVVFGLAARPFRLDPAAAVWISVLAGTANVVLIYWLVTLLASPRAGVIAAGLLAVSALHVMYSRLLLTEEFYALFLLSALIASVKYLRTRALKWILCAGASAACLQLTKYNGCLVAAPLMAILSVELLHEKDHGVRRRTGGHVLLLAGLAGASVVGNLVGLLASGGLEEFLRHYSRYMGGAVSPSGLWFYLALALPFPVLYLAVAGLSYTLYRERTTWWALVHLTLLIYIWFTFSYTFYLRLLVPVSVILVVYAAVMIDAMARLPRLAVPVLTALGLAVTLDTARDLPKFVVRDFGGYGRAADLLGRIRSDAPVFFLAQQNVWPEGVGPSTWLPSGPSRRLAIPTDARRILLVTDLYAYYKYGGRRYVRALDALQHRVLARVPNPVPYDLLENNLTIAELGRLEREPEFRERILSISLFELTPEEARVALTPGG